MRTITLVSQEHCFFLGGDKMLHKKKRSAARKQPLARGGSRLQIIPGETIDKVEQRRALCEIKRRQEQILADFAFAESLASEQNVADHADFLGLISLMFSDNFSDYYVQQSSSSSCLQHFTYSSKSDTTELETCAICTEDFKQGDKVCILECMHKFHHAEIVAWAKQKPLCPLCKHVIA